MSKRRSLRQFESSLEIIRLVVMLNVWFPLSLRILEDLLHELWDEFSHETVRFWWNRFGPVLAVEIRIRRAQMKAPLALALAVRRDVCEDQR